MAIEQLVPFAGSYDFFDKMGERVFDNGHSYSGAHFSIHSSYAAVPDYEAAMQRAYGEARAKDILGTVRHNTVYYPSLTIKGAIQTIRVVRPIAVDKTLIESWSFRLKSAPDIFFKRNVTYTRLINSPMSVVGHDDQQCYRLIQDGLAADGNEWVSLHRDYRPEERAAHDLTVERHQRDPHAQPVPRLGALHGCRMTEAEISPLHLSRSAIARRKALGRMVFPVQPTTHITGCR